jgi:hypothetical protein
MINATEIVSSGTKYLSSFMNIRTGVQAILRFRLGNFRDCNVGITDGRYLWITHLRWGKAPLCIYQVPYRLVQAFTI